jgi:hypothetical protein
MIFAARRPPRCEDARDVDLSTTGASCEDSQLVDDKRLLATLALMAREASDDEELSSDVFSSAGDCDIEEFPRRRATQPTDAAELRPSSDWTDEDRLLCECATMREEMCEQHHIGRRLRSRLVGELTQLREKHDRICSGWNARRSAWKV